LSRKAHDGHHTVDPTALHRVVRFYDELTIDAAREVLRHWQRDPAFLEAIDAIDEDLARDAADRSV